MARENEILPAEGRIPEPVRELTPTEFDNTKHFHDPADARVPPRLEDWLLITPRQIEQWILPTKPAKCMSRSRSFTGSTVEAKAIPAKITRQIVRDSIGEHLDARELAGLEAAEESERGYLSSIADAMEARP